MHSGNMCECAMLLFIHILFAFTSYYIRLVCCMFLSPSAYELMNNLINLDNNYKRNSACEFVQQ